MTDISAGDLLKPGLTGRYEADVRPEWTRAHYVLIGRGRIFHAVVLLARFESIAAGA